MRHRFIVNILFQAAAGLEEVPELQGSEDLDETLVGGLCEGVEVLAHAAVEEEGFLRGGADVDSVDGYRAGVEF